jgi:hypothetical protein
MADDLEAKVLTLLHDELDRIADEAEGAHRARLTLCVGLVDALLAGGRPEKAAGGAGP